MKLHKPTTLGATISGILGLSMVAGGVAHAQQAPAEQNARPVLGEVVVTAQKRVQALADIPMSVSVVGGGELERRQADNFQDLVPMIPGLSINNATRGVTRLTLRGINTGGVASTVGIYVNDVPFGSSSGLANAAILSGDFDTFDMDRIEVLRGPQGTLYGASSLGGVVKYVVNQPSLDGFEARVKAATEDTKGADLGYSLTGLVNVPMGQTAALRVSGFYRSDEGYVDSIGNNPVPSLQNPAVNITDGTRVEDGLNGQKTYGGRVSALFKPSDAWSLDLTAVYQNIRSDNSDTFEVDPDTLEPLYGGLVQSRYHPEWTDIDYRVYSATIDWNAGPVTLQSVTSYSEFKDHFQRDFSSFDLGPFSLSQFLTFLFSDPVTAQPPIGVIQRQTTSTDKFTQEFRLVSPESDRFDWLLGAYYTDEDSALDPQTFFAVTEPTEDIIANFPIVLGDATLHSNYKEIALFANATWHLTDRADLSFGGRWSENDQKASQTLDGLLAGGAQTFNDVKSSESPFTWSVSPRFEITDTTSLYARVATGFRPGGPNVLPTTAPPGTPASYDSDSLTSYELGLKSATPDGRYSFDFAVYQLDWKDIQLLLVINNVGLNGNGGKAKSQGFEFSATARPTDRFTVGVSGAHVNAFLSEDTHPIVGGLDRDPLPWVPDWTLGLNGTYEWPVMGDSTAYVGGMVAYTGKRTADFSNRDSNGDLRSTKSYTTVDLRTGLDTGRWSVELYAKNLTDEHGINNIDAPGFFPNDAAGIAVIRPRTIGLALGAKF